MRRVGAFVVALVLLVVLVNVALFAAFDRDSRFGPNDDRDGGPVGFWLIPVVLVVAGGVTVVRAVRRSAGTVGDVMEAAGRVAAGDYAVRVQPRGQGEVGLLAVSFNAMTDRLAENDARRRALMADVAHELRTPLAVVRGRVEGMLDGVYPRDDAQLEPLLDSVGVMTRLLEDLATLSTAEAGVLRLHREPTAPARLVVEAVAAFAPQAEAKGVTLVGRSADLAPIEVDPVRIGQVLDNLIVNALRWTPVGGRVTVTADPDLVNLRVPSLGRGTAPFSPLPSGRGAGGEGASVDTATARPVIFAVADTGPGIAPDQLPRVFDRYAKAADSGGSGLGLAIARRLVEAHAGEIWASSEQGAGTTIALRLPPS